ncbi:MAG TPA: tetratricopeptide repeat protein [Chitinophagaceae bacterium]|nr:tetratricopeptide repeat protein [Chitinophagaceae bacterium]
MNRPQWMLAGIALLAVLGLYAATTDSLFGNHPKKATTPATATVADTHAGELSIDSILLNAQPRLTPQQKIRLNTLETALNAAPPDEKLHLNHQLARYWYDSVKMFEPYAWYNGEAARLENSENSLTFAAHLFLNSLKAEANGALKHWKAHEAKDLFERSLKINPDNDSSKTGLGATLLFGEIAATPMEGIQKIREVLQRDSNNVYAQLTLGQASLLSGQLDKAVERFKKVTALQPKNLEAILLLADAYERTGDKQAAIAWYRKSLPLSTIPGFREEVDNRIKELSN